MGGNVSKETELETVSAYTLYGFGCSRCCAPPRFVHGAPRNDCCGTSCTSVSTFDPPQQYTQALGDLEDSLDEAALIAQEYTTWLSHVFCSQIDGTAAQAAKALDDEWCKSWNEGELSTAGLKCDAASEVFGYGRSRVTYLVIRVYRK